MQRPAGVCEEAKKKKSKRVGVLLTPELDFDKAPELADLILFTSVITILPPPPYTY